MAIKLSTTNPYSRGLVVNFQDLPPMLVREKEVFKASPLDEYYEVVQGDTLQSIAGDKYGDTRYWWKISDANDIDNPFELPLHSRLLIPNISE